VRLPAQSASVRLRAPVQLPAETATPLGIRPAQVSVLPAWCQPRPQAQAWTPWTIDDWIKFGATGCYPSETYIPGIGCVNLQSVCAPYKTFHIGGE
jgi:hypothetical protein